MTRSTGRPTGRPPTRPRAIVAAATALVLAVLSTLAATAVPAVAADQAFTLSLVEGEGEVFIGDNPEALEIDTPTTLAGSIDDETGEIEGVVFTTPSVTFQRESDGLVVDITASFEQIGTAEGQADGLGNVSLDLDLTLNLHLVVQGGLIVTDCRSTPISLDLVQSEPYDVVTQQVTLADPQFTIPPITDDGVCNPAVIEKVNEQLAGPDNSISLTVGGPLALPPPPGDPSTTSLSSNTASTPLNQPVTFTAQVEPTDATGTVTFLDGTVPIGQVPVEAGGTAALTTTTLAVGDHAITARYSGDVDYGPSTSALLTHTVTAIPNITADLPPFVVVGAPPTEFTATVTNPAEGGPLPNLRVDIVVNHIDGLASDDIVLEHDSDGDGTYTPIPLAGFGPYTASFGGLTGFSLPAGQEREIPFRISAPAPAQEGDVPVQVQLNTVDSTTGDVVTTLSTTAATVALVPETRRPTTMSLVGYGQSFSSTIRQGDTLQFGGSVSGPGPGLPPQFSGHLEAYIDGTRVDINADLANPDLATPRMEIPTGGGFQAYLFGGADSPTAGLTPGPHTLTVRYSGDDKYRPAVGEVSFVVVPFVGPRYDCLFNAVILAIPFQARIDVLGDVPASAPAGSTVDVERLDLDFFVEGGTVGFYDLTPETTVEQRTTASPGGTGTFGEIDVAPPVVPYEDRITAIGESAIADVPIAGAPGDVVEVGLQGFQYGFPVLEGVNATISCEAAGDPAPLGSVVVAGTTLAVDGAQPFEEGTQVPLVARVFPSDATGVVQFFSGADSIGFAAVNDGVARLNATNLEEGTHSITARYLGGLGAAPTTSAAVEVVVRDAIRCRGFAEDGDGAVVRLVYLELLDRCPDAAGYEYWVDQLDAGISPTAFARQISSSQEARKVVANDGYRTMLGRNGSPADLTYWAGYLKTRPYHLMLTAMGGSPEYWSLSGSTDVGFVTRTYQRLLGRAPDPAGRDHWTARLAAGEPRVAMLRAFTRLREPMVTVIRQSYDEILDRAPTAEEIEAQLALYRVDGNRSALYGRLIGTPAFRDRAQGFPNP